MWRVLAFFDHHSGAIQAVTSILVAALTLWLIRTTIRYVGITEAALSLSRDQFSEAMRVETFLKLRTVVRTTTALEPYVELANLSGRGIWWEKYQVIVTVGGQTGTAIEKFVEKVVHAYGVESSQCAAACYKAYRTLGLPHQKPVAALRIKATYRVSGQYQSIELEVPEIILQGPKFVFLDTPDDPDDNT
jgi:hypothetical protein